MRVLALFLIIFVGACAKKKSAPAVSEIETTKAFFTAASAITVDVAYEAGAEPYTTVTAGPFAGLSVWWILDENLSALFQGRVPAPVITVPKTAGEFTELPAQGRATWTTAELMALADRHRTGKSVAGHARFWAVFVNGHFHDGTSAQPSVVGVSIKGTTVVAIFKDVVRAQGTGLAQAVPKYVEQSTLVHEMGHALGLVANGLPMKEDHQDAGHPAHCTDPDCVMYWMNEGAAEMVGFVQRMLLGSSPSPVMFDAKCLRDAREY
jgi:hypothetical protein